MPNTLKGMSGSRTFGRSRLPPHLLRLQGILGSLVVSEDASGAVGLVFAANNTGEYAWIIPIDRVVAAFGGLRLLSGHGI